jgi:meiotic recombination protein SPO11
MRCEKIDDLLESIAIKLESNMIPTFEYPTRTTDSNVHFDVYLKMNEKNLRITKIPRSSNHVKKFDGMHKILKISSQLLKDGKTATKRDLYYLDTELFGSQKNLDAIVDDLASMFQVPRNHLNIVASCRGVVFGKLTYVEREILVDCSVFSAGRPITSWKKSNFFTKAKFVLIVEKDAVFMQLIQSNFSTRYNCILVTGKGYPDVATRSLIHQIHESINLPIFLMTDADPYGIEIASVYKYGSRAMSFQNGELATPNVIWIGVEISEFQHLGISDCSLTLSDQDLK